MTIAFAVVRAPSISEIRIITPTAHNENRGAIWTSYSADQLDGLIPEKLKFKHDKFSISKHNVLRGIHGDHKSWKLVSCVHGAVMQVVVDLRKDSPTYLLHEVFDIGAHNHTMILIPPGFGNAFYVKSENATYHYKLAYDGAYADVSEQFTVAWNDPSINIKWPTSTPILSNRDARVVE